MGAVLVLLLNFSGEDCFLWISVTFGSEDVEAFFFGDFLCFSDSEELFSVVEEFSVSDELDESDSDVDDDELLELFELESVLEATSLRAVDLGGVDDLLTEEPASWNAQKNVVNTT